MKLIAPRDVALPLSDIVAREGDVIDVPDDVGKSLVAQGWTAPKAPKKETTP